MAKKKKAVHGGHGWFVTFADLMGLLMSFFVMLTAYSTMDQKKMQMVAGSMAEAFGVAKDSRFAGIVELDGVPTRQNVKNVAHVNTSQATDHPAPRNETVKTDGSADPTQQQLHMATAAASIRQALQSNPELADLSNSVVVEETPEGINIELVDQDGRSMFDKGSAVPNIRTQALLAQIAPILAGLPNQIDISGHTAWNGLSGDHEDGPQSAHWRLSTERALAVQDALSAGGVADSRFASVVGKADTEPVIADDPSLSVNRRISILLRDGTSPVPDDLKP